MLSHCQHITLAVTLLSALCLHTQLTAALGEPLRGESEQNLQQNDYFLSQNSAKDSSRYFRTSKNTQLDDNFRSPDVLEDLKALSKLTSSIRYAPENLIKLRQDFNILENSNIASEDRMFLQNSDEVQWLKKLLKEKVNNLDNSRVRKHTYSFQPKQVVRYSQEPMAEKSPHSTLPGKSPHSMKYLQVPEKINSSNTNNTSHISITLPKIVTLSRNKRSTFEHLNNRRYDKTMENLDNRYLEDVSADRLDGSQLQDLLAISDTGNDESFEDIQDSSDIGILLSLLEPPSDLSSDDFSDTVSDSSDGSTDGTLPRLWWPLEDDDVTEEEQDDSIVGQKSKKG